MEDRRKPDPRIEKVLDFIENQASYDLSALMKAIHEIKDANDETLRKVNKLEGVMDGSNLKTSLAIASMQKMNETIGEHSVGIKQALDDILSLRKWKHDHSSWHFPSLKVMAMFTAFLTTIGGGLAGLWHWIHDAAVKGIK